MRHLKLIVGVGVVMAAILAFSAGPAMADDIDIDEEFDIEEDFEVEDIDFDVECCFVTDDELVFLLEVDDFDIDVDEDIDFDDGDENAFIFQGDDGRFHDDFVDFD